MKVAIFLYSKSKIIAQPWADAGIECHCFDLTALNSKTEDNINYHCGDIRNKRKVLGSLCRSNEVCFLGSFTPCTDLALSGAKHFEKKSLEDAFFWAKAMELVMIGVDLAEYFNIPYFIENPSSMISTLWRKPDYKFHPYMFGGYLESNHQHTLFPEIYPGRDAYNKTTWLWVGNGFKMPAYIPIEPVNKEYPGFKKLGGKSDRTKEIRSVTPEGFSRAVFEANNHCEQPTIKEIVMKNNSRRLAGG